MKSSERIQRYLDGEMKEQELNSFLRDIQKDTELREELELHKLVEKSLKEKSERKFRKQLEKSYEKYSENRQNNTVGKKKRTIRFLYFLYPVAAVLFIALAIFVKNSRPDNNSLFYQYYSPMEAAYGSRGSMNSSPEANLAAGIRAYHNGDYELSKLNLETYLSEKPEDYIIANHYLGISLIELNDYAGAVKGFRRVINGPFSYYKEHSYWYLALTLLKQNKLDEAKEIFSHISDEESFYAERSAKILKKLSRIK